MANDDFSRPLTPAGRTQARFIGNWLRSNGLEPDLALYSPALRTRQTYDEVRAACPGIRGRDAALYDASTGDLYEAVRQVAADADRLLIIGHNPGMQSFTAFLGADDGFIYDFRPATLAVLACDITAWDALAPADNPILHVIQPDRAA